MDIFSSKEEIKDLKIMIRDLEKEIREIRNSLSFLEGYVLPNDILARLRHKNQRN